MQRLGAFTIAAIIMLAGCTKTNNTTNTTIIAPLPAFVVNGIHDVSIKNGTFSSAYLPLTVQYTDSAQETVTLSLSSFPAGITMDSVNWVTSGIPTFSTELVILDTSSNGATPGSYPMTLTAVGSTSGKKTYTFNLKILPAQSCTDYIVGKYNSCLGCSGGFYTDSVYADAIVANKIWFTNFNKSGNKAYALYNCSSEMLTMPSQVIGGTTYSGNGSAFGSMSSHTISLTIMPAGGSSCTLSMN